MYLRKEFNSQLYLTVNFCFLHFSTLVGIFLVCSYGTADLVLMVSCHTLYIHLLYLMCTLFVPMKETLNPFCFCTTSPLHSEHL